LYFFFYRSRWFAFAAGDDINLIFLDYNLPDMNGQTFLELKKKSTPLIMVTSHSDLPLKVMNILML
jgi:DNA-binding response OmpR family regulator